MHESLWAEPRTWVIISFFVFFILFGRKLWAPLAGILDRRTATVRAELDEAGRLKREAEALLQDAQRRREQAVQDARALIEGARAEAQRVTAAAADDAEASAKRREQMALDRIAAAEKAAVSEIRRTATDVAARAAEQVIGETLGASQDQALIDHAISGLPATLARKAA